MRILIPSEKKRSELRAVLASRRVAGGGGPDGRDARQTRHGGPFIPSRILAGGVHIFIKCTAGPPDVGGGFGHTPNALDYGRLGLPCECWGWRRVSPVCSGIYAPCVIVPSHAIYIEFI